MERTTTADDFPAAHPPLRRGTLDPVYVWCVFYYGKPTNALWFGWMPVGVAAIGLSLLLFAFARRTD